MIERPLGVAPLTVNVASANGLPELTFHTPPLRRLVTTLCVPFSLSVAPLTEKVPAPVTLEPVLNVWLPPLKSSVAPDATA